MYRGLFHIDRSNLMPSSYNNLQWNQCDRRELEFLCCKEFTGRYHKINETRAF